MSITIRNRTPQTFKDVVINIDAVIPPHARVFDSKASIGTIEWLHHSTHATHVAGHGQWHITRLTGNKYLRLSFKVLLSHAVVDDTVTITTSVDSAQPAALAAEQTKIITIVE